MPVSHKTLCVVYASIAISALVGTWGNNIAYMNLGFAGANLAFWQDTLANPASRSITVDCFLLGLAVFVWMVLEARRLGLRFVWLYLILGMLVAISVTVPIFLINRQRALAERNRSLDAGTLSRGDVAGLVAVGAAIVAYTAATLMRT